MSQPVATPPTEADDSDPYAWEWANLQDHDREYLLSRHHRPLSCPWCRGRHRHAKNCVSLSEEFTVRLGFGKHAGKAVRDVPKDYLRWLVRKKISLDPDVKREVYEFLNIPLFDEVQT